VKTLVGCRPAFGRQKINLYMFENKAPFDSYQNYCFLSVAYPGIFFGGGVQQIQLRTEDRENGDLGAVAP